MKHAVRHDDEPHQIPDEIFYRREQQSVQTPQQRHRLYFERAIKTPGRHGLNVEDQRSREASQLWNGITRATHLHWMAAPEYKHEHVIAGNGELKQAGAAVEVWRWRIDSALQRGSVLDRLDLRQPQLFEDFADLRFALLQLALQDLRMPGSGRRSQVVLRRRIQQGGGKSIVPPSQTCQFVRQSSRERCVRAANDALLPKRERVEERTRFAPFGEFERASNSTAIDA